MHDPGRQAKVRRIPGLLRKGGRTRARGGLLLLRRTLTLCCFCNLGKIIFEGEF